MKQPARIFEGGIGVILQARLGSTRLPGKVLLPLGDTTLLGWILRRLRVLSWPVVVATTTDPRDLRIVEYCALQDVECFSGSESDVLDRYYACMNTYNFCHVIRLTADNPFPDIEELLKLAALHCEYGFDYSYSVDELPVGVGAEIFTSQSLSRSWQEGHALRHREHVNEYILENPERFQIGNLKVPAAKRKAELRLTIDTEADYQRISHCIGKLQGHAANTELLIELCSSFA